MERECEREMGGGIERVRRGGKIGTMDGFFFLAYVVVAVVAAAVASLMIPDIPGFCS